MNYEEFLDSPWQNSHPAYQASVFAIKPAPEYASGEVLVSALYRRVGFVGIGEAAVPGRGRDFEKRIRKDGYSGKSSSNISDETWRGVINRILESPKLPNQSSKPFLQMSPIVPDVALYSGAARRVGNSWSAGKLVEQMVICGASSPEEAQRIWQELYQALSIGDHDDVWAQWLQREFELRRDGEKNDEWISAAISNEDEDLSPADKNSLTFPAQQFVRDLAAVISAKDRMTRTQWVSLLGAVIRIASVTHVAWLCDVHDRLWRTLQGILVENNQLLEEEAFKAVIFPNQVAYLEYGNAAIPSFRDYASKYLVARLGINLLLWKLDIATKLPLSGVSSLHAFAKLVSEKRSELIKAGLPSIFNDLQDRQVRALGCKKGIGSNLIEFARHVLGQRQASTEILRGYDQSYFLKKKGRHASAPWVVSLGPVSVLALVHCCLHGRGGPRSVSRLSEHLMLYGLRVGTQDIANSDLGAKLRMLGLVLDSPDAESGMLLLPPFANVGTGEKNE
jgi:isoprenylcysteine carboxyl methyltransferase (ICMT) family protein YpbQ